VKLKHSHPSRDATGKVPRIAPPHRRRLLCRLAERALEDAGEGKDLSPVLTLMARVNRGIGPVSERDRMVLELVRTVGYSPQYHKLGIDRLREFYRHVMSS
ncbi:hypothetical protein ACFL2Q_09475, partial [Thermodesulfobacteriota bacterium]